MDEMTTQNVEVPETADDFLDGWNDSDSVIEDTADQQEETTQEETRETPAENGGEAAAGVGEQQATETTEESQQTAAQAQAPKVWQLRHLDDTRTVGEEELVALAQKGLDYDRIRTKYDENKDAVEIIRRMATQKGQTIAEWVTFMREAEKQASGMSAADAKRVVALEDREAAVAAKEAEQTQAQQAAQSADQGKQAAEERRAADLRRFREVFPDVAKTPGGIPKEVWADVGKGLTLVEAYSKYAVSQAQEAQQAAEHKATAAAQNQKNTARSTGSMKSAGDSSKGRDPFMEGWDE